LATIAAVLVGLVLRYHAQSQVCTAPLIACFIAQRLTLDNLAGTPNPDATLHFHATFFALYNLVLRGICWGLALLLLWKRPRDLQALAIALYLLSAGHPGPFLVLAQYWPSLAPLPTLLSILGTLGFGLFVSLFPNGRLVPRWSRWILLVWVIHAVTAPLLIFPGGMPLWYIAGVLVPQYAATVALLAFRYFRLADHDQRRQMKWVVLSALLWCAITLLNRLSIVISPPPDAPIAPLFYLHVIGFGLAVVVWPLGLAIAILRHHLFNIDVILNRTLVYVTLTALVAGMYVLMVGGLSALLQAQGSLALSLLATGLIAVLFNPLREQIQHGVDRLLYGRRGEPYAVVAQLGARLESAFTSTEILPVITATLADALRLPYVAIALEPHEPTQIAAATGAPSSDPIAFPLQYQGAVVGRLLVCPRRGEIELSPVDRRLLGELAQQAGAAVHGVSLMDELQRLNADLQWSREQLVLAREEERRRIRRDLHDDLAPTLAGLALDADTVAELVPRHPERAQTLARRLNVQIREAVGGIRRLVHNLRPPTLDEYGLLAALHERAAQLSVGEHLTITIDAPERLPPLPAAVEVAAYRIVQEALMNVVKHAGECDCTVTMTVGEDVEIVVADTGVGIAPAHPPGVGLRSMRERAEELGGRLELAAATGGGTVVRVRLPLVKEKAP
jgi:signal transduction histidine kinase